MTKLITSAQKQYIIENYKTKLNYEIAQVLGISSTSVTKFGHRAGMSKPPATKYPEEMQQKVRELYNTMSKSELAAQLGISKNALIGMAHRMGVKGGIRYNVHGVRPRPEPTARPPVVIHDRRLNGAGSAIYAIRQKAKKPMPEPMLKLETTEAIDLGKETTVTRQCTIWELNASTCKWPVAEGLFCGEESVEGKPYCAGHCARAYVRPRTWG